MPAIEGDVGAQIAAELDAGIGARDVEEARAVKRANPYVLHRLGLNRKVGRLEAVYRQKAARRRGEKRAFNETHKSSDLVTTSSAAKHSPLSILLMDKSVTKSEIYEVCFRGHVIQSV